MILGKALEGGPSTEVPVIHVGAQDAAAGLHFTFALRGVNRKTEDHLSLTCLSLYHFHCLSSYKKEKEKKSSVSG